MNSFAAEPAAWIIKAIGDEISADARALVLAVTRKDSAAEIGRRVATIRKLFVAVEKAADAFEAALENVERVNPASFWTGA